jgi:uncharacterized protein
MTHPDQRIIDFIEEHHVLTLCVSRDNIPYCASCYYAWLKNENLFIFTSGNETRHIRDVIEGNNYGVAGAIALETKIVGKIRGIQFTGTITDLSNHSSSSLQIGEIARSRYLRRFPIARLMPELHLWSLQPDFIKMTDNRLGFGKKLFWSTEEFPESGNDAL